MLHLSERKIPENITSNIKKETEFSDEETLSDQEIEKGKDCESWWDMDQDLSKYLKCSIPSCSFEPNIHQKHPLCSRVMSVTEKRIILKYLINTGQIDRAKGQKVWEDMRAQGYLTHRSIESLRNCFRRTILPKITSYGLPNHLLKRFQQLIN